MAGEMAFRAALLEHLRGDDALNALTNGIFDQATDRVTPPYVIMADSLANDWSAKAHTGYEIRVALVVHDEGEDSQRLSAMTEAVVRRVNEMPLAHTGFTLVNMQFLRSRSRRDDDGRWQALIEYRARILESSH